MGVVLNSKTVLQWSPCQGDITTTVPAFNVIVRNDDQNLLSGNLTILGPVNTFNCGVEYTPANIPVGTGYTMFFTQASDTTQDVASTRFEMRAAGSAFPSSSATDLPSSTPASGTGTSGAPAAASSSSSSTGNSAVSLSFNKLGMAVTALGAVSFVAALL
ncbi:hypothetical protein BU17DRAFT_82714 [Hysterangium stoloniferum]|nr:hypothetical protein BU17DRAFT_82714 [Hysterangium stoloniferum]